MKKIFIPVAIVVLILAIIAVILSRTDSNEGLGYHVHENGETHYDTISDQEYHTHENGETHYNTN